MFIRRKTLRRIRVVMGIGLLLLAGIAANHWLNTSPMGVSKPIDQIKTDRLVMALTINVDWGEEYIPPLLDILDQAEARATFFVTGRWAKNNQELLKTIAVRGHQIENHGYSHPHPDRLSVEANREEIEKTESIIAGITGKKTHFYAPPYGEKGASGLRASDALGYQTVLWTLDTVDWRADSTPEVIAKRILNPASQFGTKPNKSGAIVLMHPKENTVKALPVILEKLTQDGFCFQTLDELITLGEIGNTTS